MAKHKVGSVNEFPEGKARSVDIDGIRIAVFNVNGELYGIQDNCLHKDLPLSEIGERARKDPSLCSHKADHTKGKIDEENLTVSCAFHFVKWDLETGKSPTFDYQLPTYDVSVEGEDVYVRL